MKWLVASAIVGSLCIGAGASFAESFYMRRQAPGTSGGIIGPVTLVDDSGARRWSNGEDPTSCKSYVSHPTYETVSGDSSADNGYYWINPGGGAVQVFCEMSLDGGGWTRVWRSAADNHNVSAPNLPYDVNISVVSGSAEIMFAYSNTLTEALTLPFKFPTPSQARTDNFLNYDHERVSVNATDLTSQITYPNATLVFGNDNYGNNPSDISNCDGPNTTNPTSDFGRICIDNTPAPYFNRWAYAGSTSDACTVSTQDHSGQACSATRRFAIFARSGEAQPEADIVLSNINSARRWNDYSYAASCDAYRHPAPGHAYAGATGDGVYAIDPLGGSPFNVWCDMNSDGGGWTLVWRYGFTNYANFTAGSNAVTPIPSWPGHTTNVSISTTAPTAHDDDNYGSNLGALDYAMWNDLGATHFMVRSNINDHLVCDGAGYLVNNVASLIGNPQVISCFELNEIHDGAACADHEPNRIYGHTYGPYIAWSGNSTKYYWDGNTGANWPTHDPCAANQPNQKPGVANPGGSIWLR